MTQICGLGAVILRPLARCTTVTSALQSTEGPGDAELISAVRGGDTRAYGLLFERHVAAAQRLARQLAPGPDSEDLVAEAFAKVLVLLQRGGGPDLAFRAYLLTTVRRLHVDRGRARARVKVTDDLTPYDAGIPFRDTAVEGFECAAAARAFASLPKTWQLVLWHTEVEGQKPAAVAALLNMSPNAVSALAYRAREGLRQAFLSMHVAEHADAGCRWVGQNLGSYIRGGLSRRATRNLETHLKQCRPCAATHLELTHVNQSLSDLLAPALTVPAAVSWVASTVGIVVGLLGRIRDFVATHVASSVAGAAATTVIGGAIVLAGPPPMTPPTAGAPPIETVRPETAPPAFDGRHDDREAEHERQALAPARDRGAAPLRSGVPSAPLVRQVGRTIADAAATDQPTAPAADVSQADPQPGTQGEPERYDVALETSVVRSGVSGSMITVTVTGLPAGRSATLVGRGRGLVPRLDRYCHSTAGGAATCTVSSTPTTYHFVATAGTVAFEVTLVGGGTDAASRNNRSTVTVS